MQKPLALGGLLLVLLSGAIIVVSARRYFDVCDTNYNFLLLEPPYTLGVVSPEPFQYRDKVQSIVESVQGQEHRFNYWLLVSCFLLLVGMATGAWGFILRRRIRTAAA